MQTWKEITGYEGAYSVSNDGLIRNDRTMVILHPAITYGYCHVSLYRADGSHANRRVHRAVADAFLGLRPVGTQINHRNGIKTDNDIGNLEYVTPKENIHHSMRVNGTHCRAQNGRTKLSLFAISEIRRRYKRRVVTQDMLAGEFGVNRGHISQIILGKSPWPSMIIPQLPRKKVKR